MMDMKQDLEKQFELYCELLTKNQLMTERCLQLQSELDHTTSKLMMQKTAYEKRITNLED